MGYDRLKIIGSCCVCTERERKREREKREREKQKKRKREKARYSNRIYGITVIKPLNGHHISAYTGLPSERFSLFSSEMLWTKLFSRGIHTFCATVCENSTNSSVLSGVMVFSDVGLIRQKFLLFLVAINYWAWYK